MFKNLKPILIVIAIVAFIASSCDNPSTPEPSESYWKQVDKEIWWTYKISTSIPGDVAWSVRENINSFPYGATYTVVYSNDTYKYALIGSEFNLTCTDSSYALARKWTTKFTWDPLPTNMTADSLYSIGAETKGDGGNMMYISNSYKASGTTNDWIVTANKNAGKILGKVKIAKPIDETKADKMAIKFNIASAYANIEYIYIYQWIAK